MLSVSCKKHTTKTWWVWKWNRLELPPEQLLEPESCCIHHDCNSRRCHSVSRSLQTWYCWWPGLPWGTPDEVLARTSAASAEERSSYRFGQDDPRTRVRIRLLSA
jgi:hypothetical protein